MYNFSEFSCSLNEPEEGVCPTDSRLRPDQRVMENQDFDTANKEKVCQQDQERMNHHSLIHTFTGYILIESDLELFVIPANASMKGDGPNYSFNLTLQNYWINRI